MAKSETSAIDWRAELRALYPTRQELPFCAALEAGDVDRPGVLRAEAVEFYRAINTRGRLHAGYVDKARAACDAGRLSQRDVDLIEDLLADEGETEDHIDHVDMCYKLYRHTPVDRGVLPRHDATIESINRQWMEICDEADIFELIAIMGAIEDWYAPMSEFFEVEYRSRGFGDDELEIFIVHKDADVEHSTIQFELLERSDCDSTAVLDMVRRTFVTSRAYDASKLRLARSGFSLSELFDFSEQADGVTP